MKNKLFLIMSIFLLCSYGVILTGCGTALSPDDDARSDLFNITLESFSPAKSPKLSKSCSFLEPIDILSYADNPMVAILWCDLPGSSKYWTTNANDTDYIDIIDFKSSWPFKISLSFKEPPKILHTLKEHPESKAALGFFVIFNDGNHNKKLDSFEYWSADNHSGGAFVPFGPYGHFTQTENDIESINNDTITSKPMTSLKDLKKDWIIGFCPMHPVFYASDQYVCDWLQQRYTYKEAIGKDLNDCELRFKFMWSEFDSTLHFNESDTVQMFERLKPGYNLLKAVDTSTVLYDEGVRDSSYYYDRSFKKSTKQWLEWKVFSNKYMCEALIFKKFLRVDPSSEIAKFLITDDENEFLRWFLAE